MFKRSLVFSLIIIFLGVNLVYAETQRKSWDLTDEEIQRAIEIGESEKASDFLYGQFKENENKMNPAILIWTPFKKLVSHVEQFTYKAGKIGINLFDVMVGKILGGGKAVVNEVVDNSPAQKAGILPGDIILQLNGKPLKDVDMVGILNFFHGPVGTKVTVTVERKGKPITVEIIRDVVKYPYSIDDIKKSLEGYIKPLEVEVLVFGNRVDFAKYYQCVIQVMGELIYPIKVKNQEVADKTSVWPDFPPYKAKCRYIFSTKDIPRDAIIRIIIPEDPRADWKVNLSEIP